MAAAVGIVTAIVSVASTAYSAYSSHQAGRKEERTQERAAEQRLTAARQEAEDERKRHQRILATQRARYGAAGLTMEGSPLLVQMESIRESEEQLSRILQAGETEAYWHTRAGREARRAGTAEAIGDILGGATTFTQIGRQYDWW